MITCISFRSNPPQTQMGAWASSIVRALHIPKYSFGWCLGFDTALSFQGCQGVPPVEFRERVRAGRFGGKWRVWLAHAEVSRFGRRPRGGRGVRWHGWQCPERARWSVRCCKAEGVSHLEVANRAPVNHPQRTTSNDWGGGVFSSERKNGKTGRSRKITFWLALQRSVGSVPGVCA